MDAVERHHGIGRNRNHTDYDCRRVRKCSLSPQAGRIKNTGDEHAEKDGLHDSRPMKQVHSVESPFLEPGRSAGEQALPPKSDYALNPHGSLNCLTDATCLRKTIIGTLLPESADVMNILKDTLRLANYQGGNFEIEERAGSLKIHF
jgi:hypothetical protein